VTRLHLAAIYCCLAGGALAAACGGSGALPAPASDSQYDDPDEPGGGPGNPGSAPDASGDAQGKFCVADRDCPATHACVFAISAGCSATGACMLYSPTKDCSDSFVCGCNGQNVTLCAPAGYATGPAKTGTPCAIVMDASIPDTSVADTSVADTSTPDAATD